jgi:hypothetical protein
LDVTLSAPPSELVNFNPTKNASRHPMPIDDGPFNPSSKPSSHHCGCHHCGSSNDDRPGRSCEQRPNQCSRALDPYRTLVQFSLAGIEPTQPGARALISRPTQPVTVPNVVGVPSFLHLEDGSCRGDEEARAQPHIRRRERGLYRWRRSGPQV